ESTSAERGVGGPRTSVTRSPYGFELRLLGRAAQRERRRVAAGDRGRHEVEPAGADLALVAGRRVGAPLALALPLLEPHVGRHALLAVAHRELEHRGVQRVEAGQRDELERVAEPGELVAEAGDLVVGEVPAPVERRRAVVREQLSGEALVHGL